MTATIKLANLKTDLEDDVEQGKQTLAKWAESFAQNPIHALSWSRNTFKVASEIDIAQRTLAQIANAESNGINAEQVVKQLRFSLTADVLTSAQYVPSSTSPTSNLMEAENTAAAARLLAKFAWLM